MQKQNGYAGRHVAAKGPKKKLLVLSATVVLLALISVGSTLGMLQDSTDTVENPFTPGQGDIGIIESSGSSETSGESYELDSSGSADKNVWITNPEGSLNVPMYIRVRLVPVWRNSTGENAGNIDREIKYNLAEGWTQNWVQNGDYYYYKKVLQPGETTEQLLDSVHVDGGIPEGMTLEIQVIADSIQAEGGAAQEAWGVDPATGSTLPTA